LTLCKEDCDDLARELEKLAGVAKDAAKIVAKDEKPFKTDGIDSAVKGIDAIGKFLKKILGPYGAKDVELSRLKHVLKQEKDRYKREIAQREAEKIGQIAAEETSGSQSEPRLQTRRRSPAAPAKPQRVPTLSRKRK
jgi:hypothetical protein